MTEPEKLPLTSMDIAGQRREELKALYPSVFTETKDENGKLVESIDFEKLKAELGTFSDVFENRRERYGMDWPGKKEAMKILERPSVATLKPAIDESLQFNETRNLFIEGDNFEVLKLLQKSHYGKVKAVYIDPPYNTGEEFIYPDKFSETLDTYLWYAGLVDREGRKFSSNRSSEGRFHTNWLNMMIPRITLARNLLCDDGIFLVSIGEDEVANLRNLCNEVFGEENFVATISRLMKSGGAKGRFFTPNIDYVLVYSRNISHAAPFRAAITKDQIDGYYNKIEESGERAGQRYGEERLFKASLDPRANQRYWIECPDGSFVIPPGRLFPEDISNGSKVTPSAEDKVWKWTFDRYKDEYESGNIVFKETTTSGLLNDQKTQAKWNIYNKLWLVEQQEKGKVPSNFIGKFENRQSSAELRAMDIPFDYAKPKNLLKYLLEIVRTKDDDIVLDFFSGSASTAHAVMELNHEDGHRRRFIMVQLPEPCDPESEAYKAGFLTIADIGKERIRRASAEIQASREGTLDLDPEGIDLDLGFKCFKLERSNFSVWNQENASMDGEQLAAQLELYVDHIDDSASQEDILFELLLKAGFDIAENVSSLEMAGCKIFAVADGGLLICLEDEITRELIDAVAEAEPMQFICLDRAFKGNDQLKANAVQTFAARNQGREKAEQIIFRTV